MTRVEESKVLHKYFLFHSGFIILPLPHPSVMSHDHLPHGQNK